MNAIPLTPLDLALAAALVLVAGAVSVALRLTLERSLALASVRTVAQLLLVGFVLEWVFDLDRAPLVLALMGVMVVLAGRTAVNRSGRRYPGLYLQSIATLIITGLLTTFVVTGAIVGVDPWYRPQYVIPLLGMILGNSLTGISLTLDHILESLAEGRDVIECDLALGATRWEAAREPVAAAVRRGMIPIINAMMVVGVVSLPGMMTGQILAGANPIEAVKYQIVVMFMLAAATSLGCIGVAMLAFRSLFNARHQLRAERIVRSRGR